MATYSKEFKDKTISIILPLSSEPISKISKSSHIIEEKFNLSEEQMAYFRENFTIPLC